MDSKTPLDSEKESVSIDEVQVRHHKNDVKFYLRDSTAADEGNIDSDTNEISDDFSKLPVRHDDDLRKHNLNARSRRKEWSLSEGKSFDIPDRTPSDDTLTSVSSSSASTLERPSSDEIQRESVLSSSSSSANCSSCTPKQLQKENSEDGANVTESCVSVPAMSSGYSRMSSIDKRDVYKNSSTESGSNSSGIFSGSRSSSQLNPNSTTSLTAVENDGINLDAKKIRRNFRKIIEEIDPVVLLSPMHKKECINSEAMFLIQELSSRRQRAIETVLFVLTSNKSSEFYTICRDTYEYVVKSLDKDKPSSKVLTYICENCSEKMKAWVLCFLQDIQSQISFNVCINVLLYRLMEVDLVSPKDVKSVHRGTKEDKIKLLTNVASRLSQGASSNNIGDFLWALLSPDTITSKEDLTEIASIFKENACEICKQVLHKLVNEDVDTNLSMSSINKGAEETKKITVLYNDFSSRKELKEKVVFIKLETKNDVQVKEILSRKKYMLNELIDDIARIDDVLVGSVILKLTFKDIGSTTVDTYCKIERVLQAILSEQEIRGYLENKDMEISVSISDTDEGTDVGDLLNKKLTIMLNMTTLLEELDAISFKQKFVDKMIMSDKDFECQFRTQELGRRARTTLLLEYVLTKNANVMNVFFEVIGMTYNFLTDTLLKRNFIDRDETEEKQRLFTKTAVQHNEIEDNITANSELNIDSVLSPVCSLGIGDITVQHTNNVNTPEQIVPPVCSGHEFLKPKDVTIHFVDGLLNKDRNNGMQTTVPCQNLNRAPLSRPVENFDDNLHCRGSNNKTDQTSETSSYLSSSGPRAMLLGGTNSMNNNTQTQPLIYSNGLKDLLLKQSSESKFDSGSVELPLPSDSVANQSPKIPSDLNLNGSNITSSEQIGNLSAINSMTEQSSQNTHDLSISEEERLLRSNNATGKSSTSYPFSDTTSQSFHFSSDLTSSGSREMNLAHKTQNPKLHQSLEFVSRKPEMTCGKSVSKKSNEGINDSTALHCRDGTIHVKVSTTDEDGKETLHPANVKFING